MFGHAAMFLMEIYMNPDSLRRIAIGELALAR